MMILKITLRLYYYLGAVHKCKTLIEQKVIECHAFYNYGFFFPLKKIVEKRVKNCMQNSQKQSKCHNRFIIARLKAKLSYVSLSSKASLSSTSKGLFESFWLVEIEMIEHNLIPI